MNNIKTEVLVLGSGPGGYSAAFRAADLGKEVTLVEKYNKIGGICLHVGCVPSKTLLHIAKVIHQAKSLKQQELLVFNNFNYNKKRILNYKDNLVKKLTDGLTNLAKQRKIKVIEGIGKFSSPHSVEIITKRDNYNVRFKKAIIAVGSRPLELEFMPKDPRIINSTKALLLKKIPNRMLIIGGGIIGLEMAQIYSELGTSITIVELADQLINIADSDIVNPYEKILSKIYKIHLKAKVTLVNAKKDGLYVSIEKNGSTLKAQCFDCILVAIGRTPNSKLINAEKAGIKVDPLGFIITDTQCKTNLSHIFAIGDVIGQPMLAHKSVAEGRLVAEVIAGYKHYFEPKCIPSVVYTNPEIAWVGMTEKEALKKRIVYGKGVFPWVANSRALSTGHNEGLTKVIYDKDNMIIGAGILGPNAGELIAEAALAIETCCYAEDISLTIHPHPTLSETFAMATEVYEGTATDIYAPKTR